MKGLFILFFITVPFMSFSQVKHNFEMGPEHTNCHELPQSFSSSEDAIQAIRTTRFRSQETVRISRYRAPRSASFYTCDGKSGYLIVKENESSQVVYMKVPSSVWKEFINSRDPIGFYSSQIKDKLPSLK